MKKWHYETAPDLELSPIERLRRFPREPDMLVYGVRSLTALAIRAWLKLYHRLKIVGRENLPREGSFVLVANHASHLDTLCLLSSIPLRRLHRAFPAAAKDYFFVSVPRLAVAAVAVNALPFDRLARVRRSLDLCREILSHPGNILVVFPEGTRSARGRIREFKPGVGMLLAGTSVPAVPCYLENTFRAWPKGSSLPRPLPVRLAIGRSRSFASLPPGKDSARRISQELREAVLELAGEGPGPVNAD